DRAKFTKYVSKLKPGLTTALLLARAGFTDEAQKLLSERKKSAGSDTKPVQDVMRIVEAEIALSRGQTTEAISLLQEALPAVRWNSGAIFFMVSLSLADAFERQGDLQKSIQVLERASEASAITNQPNGSRRQCWLR